jgi:Fe-S-cluster containining protein
MNPDDIARAAQLLGISVDAFCAAYTRAPEIAEHAQVGDLWLIDKPGPEMECVFLDGNRCRIHLAKPTQCIGFPLKWRTPDVLDYCIGMQA